MSAIFAHRLDIYTMVLRLHNNDTTTIQILTFSIHLVHVLITWVAPTCAPLILKALCITAIDPTSCLPQKLEYEYTCIS